MQIKRYLAFLIIIMVLLLSIFSSIPSQSLLLSSDYNPITQSLDRKDTKKVLDVKLNILINDRAGSTKKILREINKTDLNNLNKDLVNNLHSDLKYIEKFEYVLQKLKDNNLISNNIKLEDIIDLSKFENESLKFDNVTNKNFVAHFSPTIVLGGGLGLGLGDIDRRLSNGFVHFFAVLSGAALVLCLDFLANTAYILFTLYFLPSFIGYMAGFTGIIMFAVYPGLVYMNLLMLGFVPFAFWLSLPEID